MAVTKIKGTSSFTNLTKYDSFLAGNAAYAPGAYESIATLTASGGESSISFTSIPSTYQHLQIRGITRFAFASTGNGVAWCRINNDSGSNYARHELTGNGTAVSAAGAATQSLALYYPAPFDSNPANIFGSVIIDLHNYASTTQNKTVRAFAGSDLNGSGEIYLSSMLWQSTTAVNRFDLFTGGNNWKAGTTFALYGIKGS